MTAPLKLNGTAGDLKEITTTEENYLAYLAGLQLAAMTSSDVSALTTSSGGTSIGSYTNTFFNEAVGTHDGTNITSGSTTTTLYQNTGTASEASVDFHRPVRWAGSGNIEEHDNTEFNSVTDRLLSTIFTNDYPGVYKLAASSPGADWDVHLASVFTDTQSLGVTAATYNIYQRQTMTAPTTVLTVKILNDTTAFDGLKEMNATEMQVTFGQRAKTRIMSSSNYIGAYQLRSSAQGAPVAAGTWRAVGTATDTKDTTTNVSYSGTYTGTYTGSYTGNYTGFYANSFTGTYSRAFTGNYTRGFTGFYTGSFAGTYSSSFTGTYTGSFAGGYSRLVLTGFTSFYVGVPGNRSPTSATFSRNVLTTFTGFYSRSFTGTYTGFYTGFYSRAFTGSYTGTFTGFYVGGFTGFYANSFAGTYTGSYTGDYTGNYTGSYTGLTIDATDTTIETYTLYVRAA
jgi:hypothetical protein